MIVFKLAISYLKKQRGKTLSLILSIVLSVVLVFSMIVIRDSGYDSQIKEAKELNGNYQVSFEKISENKANKLGSNNEVKKLTKVKQFCEAVDKSSGVKFTLNSFSKDFLKSLNYKMIGKRPLKDGEIVIEKETASQMGIKNPLNKSVNLMLTNNYVDSSGKNKINSVNKVFKIVGIIEKSDKYYNTLSDSIGGIETQAFTYKNENFPLKTIDLYKGIVFLKSEKNTQEFLDKMENSLKLDTDQLSENTEVDTAKQLKMMSIYSFSNIKKMILLVFIACLVIYNIFNIVLKDMMNEIGLLRSIGMSKKKIKNMFVIFGFVYIIFGTLIGLLLGTILSYFGEMIIYGCNSMLTINTQSIVCSFAVSIISVFISSLLLIRKTMKISIVDSIRVSEKYKKRLKLRSQRVNPSKSKLNIIFTMTNRNIWRNKSRSIITIIAVTALGIMFICNFASESEVNSSIEEGIGGGIFGMSYGSVDKTISGSHNGTDSLFYKIDKKILNNIKNIDGVKDIEPNFYNPSSYLLLSKDKISKSYQDELNRRSSLYKKRYNEYPLVVRGYSDKMLKKRETFIDKGSNILKSTYGKYKKILLVNNTNSQITHTFDARVIDNVKVGSVISIKLPIYKNGLKDYKEVQVEVSGIMKESYASGQDGNVDADGAQVIFREDDYRELTGQNNYNKVYVMTQNGDLKSVEKKLYKLTKDYAFSSIGGKGEDMKFYGNQQSSEERLSIVYQLILILILCINNIFIMRSNMISRKKEMSILRAIGMSLKDIRISLIIESEFYVLIACVIGSVIAKIYYNLKIEHINKILLSSGFERTIKSTTIFSQIVILFVIFAVIGYISVCASRGILKNTKIIDGISKDD